MNKQDNTFIHAEYRDKVSGFVRSKICNQNDVEDIVQTVFMKVYDGTNKMLEG